MAQNQKSKPTTSTKPKHDAVFEATGECMRKLEARQKANASASALLLKAEATIATAKKEFADATARAMAESPNGHLPTKSTTAEKQKWDRANTDLVEAEQAVLGCRRALRESDIEALALRDKLRAACEAYKNGVVAEFMEQHSATIAAYKQFLQLGSALADALNIPLISPSTDWLAQAVVDGPRYPSWQQSKDAIELNREHRDPYRWLKQIERLAEMAEYRKQHPQNYPPDQDVPRQRYQVRRAVRIHGVEYQPGTRVSAFTIAQWPLLDKLVTSGHLRPVE